MIKEKKKIERKRSLNSIYPKIQIDESAKRGSGKIQYVLDKKLKGSEF